MPRLSAWFIRAALFYLAVGFTLGGLLLANKGLPAPQAVPIVWRLLPTHIEFLLVAWTTQLAMGMAFWILPRFSRGPERGNETPAWIALFLINAGVLLAGLGQTLGAPGWILLTGRAAQVCAALAFALHAWPRVKPLSTSAG